jgi:diaminohydroxyphosphoribosylaminopyrimidine deaminase/5-amino-6-(5-phosphoribosylamino)uracil reductase
MAAAARLAARSNPLSRPNPGVGAVLVSQDLVVARGWTQASGRPHAEAHALSGIGAGGARGMVLYVTLEPCAHQSARGPACLDLVTAAAPARVVIGQRDPDPRTAGQSIERLQQAGIAVDVIDDPASRTSLRGYLMKAHSGRPWVTLKLAMSLDGCIALADGTSRWITGATARAHVHAQRACNDAILVGGSTWRSDQPRLDVRLPGIEQRSPRPVVLTRSGSPDGAAAIAAPEQIGTLEGVHYLYVEGGAQTAASFLAADLVDEIHLYRAPIVIGDGLRSVGPLGLADLASAHGRWAIADQRQLGSDNFTAYLRVR